MIRYLLDSNAVSELIRDPSGTIATSIGLLEDGEVAISIVVAAEIMYGAEKRGSGRLRHRAETVLGALDIVALDKPSEIHYGRLRSVLEKVGAPIGPHDRLIAAHALAMNCILVTDNEREFRRVPGLRVENWLREA